MLIEFEFSGGYTNLTKKYVVNTENLPDDLADEIDRFITETEIFNINQKDIAENSMVRDAICYKLKLQDAKRSLVLNFDDVSMPIQIRAFVQRLKEFAFHT
ncbi:MAG: hypothetical protein O6761_02590 [Thaumarchaeota archaeon]|nr:hypothetical protein [Nitrososphaerota archaeon]